MPTLPRCFRLTLIGVVLTLCVGCETPGTGELRKCLGEGCETLHRPEVSIKRRYQLGCRDVVDVAVDGRAPVRVAVQPDGTITLNPTETYLVEGQTASDVETAIARHRSCHPSEVHVRVIGFHSAQVYVFGLVKGRPRAVPYCGPERVTDLLQRLGGLDSGAAVNDVHLIRSQIANGSQLIVHHVDVRDIFLHNQQQTNIEVQPGDQIYIGETKRSAILRLYPEWIRPMLNSFWMLIPSTNVLKRTLDRGVASELTE